MIDKLNPLYARGVKPIPVIPTVYTDALSYGEQLGIMGHKTDECVAKVNEIIEDNQTFKSEITEQQGEFEGTMQEQYDQFLEDYQRQFGVVQGKGTSITDVMSQKAVSDEFDKVLYKPNNTFGLDGQVLESTGTGVKWSDVGAPTQTQVNRAVTDWLDEHPEATTTVEDDSLTIAKIANPLKTKINDIVVAINETDVASYLGTDCTVKGNIIEVENTINITDVENITNTKFDGITFMLNVPLFSFTNQYKALPTFVNCKFVGGNIVDGSAYISRSNFINCEFNDCEVFNTTTYIQITRFINCTFIGNKSVLISPYVNDVVFDNCIFDNDFDGKILESKGGRVKLINSIAEGNSNVLFDINNDTDNQTVDINIENCYFENNLDGLIKIVSTATVFSLLSIEVKGCYLSWNLTGALISLPSNIPVSTAIPSRYFINLIGNSLSTGGTEQNILSRYDLDNTFMLNQFVSSNLRFAFKNNINNTAVLANYGAFNSSVTTFTTAQKNFMITYICYTGGIHINASIVLTRSNGTSYILNVAGDNTVAVSNDDSGNVIVNWSGLGIYPETFKIVPFDILSTFNGTIK